MPARAMCRRRGRVGLLSVNDPPMTETMLFEVWDGDVVVGTFETPKDALIKGHALVQAGATWVVIVDAIGRRYTPLEFERLFMPKPPPERNP
jgi:hypothetical protein